MPTEGAIRIIPELSLVALTHAREHEGRVLPEGTRGAVVYAYRDGEVEFDEPFHCVVTVERDDIRALEPVGTCDAG